MRRLSHTGGWVPEATPTPALGTHPADGGQQASPRLDPGQTNLLKAAGRGFSRIFVKKDLHPSIRKEWKRLHDAERAEKERPEKDGCVIRLDFRERKLYRNETVIDSWNLQCF